MATSRLAMPAFFIRAMFLFALPVFPCGCSSSPADATTGADTIEERMAAQVEWYKRRRDPSKGSE